MDGICNIRCTDQFHSGIVRRVQVRKAVLWHNSTFKSDAFCFPQTLFQIGHAPHFATESYFADGNELIADRAVQQ